METLGNLLELTLADDTPTEVTQQTSDGTELRWLGEGILEITPPKGRDHNLDLLLSAGLHGNETAPIELLDRLVKSITCGELRARNRVLVMFGNPEAMRQGVRFVGEDVNRLFTAGDTSSQSSEARRAKLLKSTAEAFFTNNTRSKLHYDLHTAIRGSKIEQFALYPWSRGRTPSTLELRRLSRCGIEAVLLQRKVGVTFSSYTYNSLGAESLTIELGKARPFGQNQSLDLSTIESVIRSLVDGTYCDVPDAAQPLKVFEVSREIIKLSDQFKLNLADSVQNFTHLPIGYVLAEDADGERWVIDEENAHIIFPNPNVKNGLRAGLIIIPQADKER
ncbi:succinylglutamate desuccinylase [Pseudomonas asiatica]|uniref:succinylglutamate desuccinylase n=1 Tax=Pseudomonas TaxID=286 RepID=UPI00159669AB|nr:MULTISPECIES: succinylglutamate desuccinylase [Pseudomonas]MDD2077016.1 succinylglutamate desuccinylase [Pseudomonas putida]QNT40638.1 succinylglutamate desuccinylase [Pseudomonas asiatica]HDS1693561.1 succinylglutamate desuccinylase [Pseudomonas putida]